MLQSNKASCFCIPVSSTFSPGNNNSKNIRPRSVVQKKGPDPSKTPWIAMVAASSSPGVWSLYSRGISSPLPSTWPNGQQENISGTLRYHMQETGTPCPILWSIPPFKVSQSYTSCFPKKRIFARSKRIVARTLPLLIALRNSAFNSLEVASIRIGKTIVKVDWGPWRRLPTRTVYRDEPTIHC